MNLLTILNILVLAGIIVTSLCSVFFKGVLSSVLALGAAGAFVSLEFILLQAPDVAIAEAAVGAVVSTVIFVIAVRKTTPKKEDEK